jgi:hypothetical protein
MKAIGFFILLIFLTSESQTMTGLLVQLIVSIITLILVIKYENSFSNIA